MNKSYFGYHTTNNCNNRKNNNCNSNCDNIIKEKCYKYIVSIPGPTGATGPSGVGVY